MTPALKAMVSASVVVHFPVLRAMAEVVESKTASLYAGLTLQSFGVRWFQEEMRAGGYLCPMCGNLWTTRDKRLACNHVGGSPSPSTVDTLSAWIAMAEEEL